MTDKEQEMLDKQLLDTVINGGTTEEVEQLIKKGANVNTSNKEGETPLMYAIDTEMTKLLIKAGADVNAVNQFGETALDRANEAGQVKALLSVGAEVEKANKSWQGIIANIQKLPYVQDSASVADFVSEDVKVLVEEMHKQRTVHDYQAKNSERQASQASKEEIAKPVKENKGKAVEFDMNKMPVRDGR